MVKASLVLFFTVVYSSVAVAEFYQGIRQMGMGGAAVAVVNDETALLLNPTGLSRLREPYVTLIDPEVTTNMDSVGTVQSLALDSMEVDKVYNELAGRLDQNYFMRAQIFPSFVTRNFGVGFLGKQEMLARRNSADHFLNLNYTSDMVGVVGYNHSLAGGMIKVGVAGRYIDRVEYKGVVDPAVQGMDIKNFGVSGTGIAGDVAVSLSSPTIYLPTLSVIAKDVGDTSFSLGKGMRNDYLGVGDPDKVPMTVDVAAALFPIWSKSSRGTITVEYDDVTNDGEANKKLHAGLEVNMADRFFFRGGWNRGYLTGGFEFATQNLQIQLAYYGEEIGTDENPIRDDRVALKFVMRF